MWKPTSKSSNLATLLGVSGLNYGLWPSSSLLPVSVNNILEEHSHGFILVLPMVTFLLQRLSRRAERETICPAKPQYLPSGPSLKVCWPCTRPHLASVEWSKISRRDGCSQSHLQWSDPEVLSTQQCPPGPWCQHGLHATDAWTTTQPRAVERLSLQRTWLISGGPMISVIKHVRLNK